MILDKEMLLTEEQQGSRVATSMVSECAGQRKGPTGCARCGRKLTNPHSIARNLGPVCYRAAGGGAFDKDMQASDEEWQRREKLLRTGGESDFGYCDYVYQAKDGPVVLKHIMRISVRFYGGLYEAYGSVNAFGVQAEPVFYRGDDIKACWAAAIAAGPECNAAAYRVEREITRAWKAQWKARVRGGGR